MPSPSYDDRLIAMFDSYCKEVSRNYIKDAEIGEGSYGDALRAQAVAARTFALRRVLAGIVVDDTTSFQAYRAELLDCSPRSREAVADTAGVVLVYGGEVIDC